MAEYQHRLNAVMSPLFYENYFKQMNETKNKNQLRKDWKWVKLKKMWQLFGDKTDEIIIELNEVLAA